jgi:quinol-cytochrome oxidoreductase complex cytochrome b subunit
VAESDKRRYFHNLLLHFRPSEVPERTLRLTLTWGLGGIAAVLFVLLIVTGLALKFVYEPVPDRAYDSILYLRDQIPFGQLLRNLHRWCGNGLVLTAFLHLLRVVYTGALDRSRSGNWQIGLALIAAVVLSNFTGYLLPWDQIAYWAVTISTSMLDYLPVAGPTLKVWILGGVEPGPVALLNFYAIHTAILPALLVFTLPFHFWRVRTAGGLVVPRAPGEPVGTVGPMVDAVPHLITRELAMAILTLAAMVLIAMFFDAPLAEQANPGLSPNPTKAPWYFMGLQELLFHFHPTFGALVIPGLMIAGLIALPYLCDWQTTSGVWFASGTGRRMMAAAALIAVLGTVGGVVLDEFVLSSELTEPPGLLLHGLLPFTVIALIVAAICLGLKRIFGGSRCETVQVLFTLIVTAFAALTVIGVWFRGAGMQLTWSGS